MLLSISIGRLFCLFLALAGTLGPAWAEAPKELWVRRYDGLRQLYDKALNVAVDHSGNVIVAGSESYSSFRYTAKYAAGDGALLRIGRIM
jgi:hypothetical protein